jgi:predicted 3-demethylubiquinone-9 3-methyltransferase (glyoxalase superfamily)
MNSRANLPSKNTICLWFDRDAEEAARFYASVFPDSFVNAVVGLFTYGRFCGGAGSLLSDDILILSRPIRTA